MNVWKPVLTHRSAAMHHTQQRTVALLPLLCFGLPLLFSLGHLFRRQNIQRCASWILCNTRAQTVCFLSVENMGSQKGRKHFCRHDVHKRSQTSSVPVKNRRYMVEFFFPSLIWTLFILYAEKYMFIKKQKLLY